MHVVRTERMLARLALGGVVMSDTSITLTPSLVGHHPVTLRHAKRPISDAGMQDGYWRLKELS